jgi:ABC-type Fe3+ transport system substrate-binding protein
LPVKPVPTFEEGTYASVGNGGPIVIKNPPHPNAAKVFINWFLSREGQEIYSRAFGHATRRLDVDTKWMADVGVRPAKDFLTLEQYQKFEIASEEKVLNVRDPGRELAKKLLR